MLNEQGVSHMPSRSHRRLLSRPRFGQYFGIGKRLTEAFSIGKSICVKGEARSSERFVGGSQHGFPLSRCPAVMEVF